MFYGTAREVTVHRNMQHTVAQSPTDHKFNSVQFTPCNSKLHTLWFDTVICPLLHSPHGAQEDKQRLEQHTQEEAEQHCLLNITKYKVHKDTNGHSTSIMYSIHQKEHFVLTPQCYTYTLTPWHIHIDDTVDGKARWFIRRKTIKVHVPRHVVSTHSSLIVQC